MSGERKKLMKMRCSCTPRQEGGYHGCDRCKALYKLDTKERQIAAMDFSNLGPTIQLTRRTRWMTLPELAREAGISKGGLSKIEHGGNFTIETLYKLAAALQVAPSSLLR